MLLRANSRITLYPLHFSNVPVDNDQYAVVRWDTDDSLYIGTEAYYVMHYMLQKPRSIAEIVQKTDLGPREIISFVHILMDAHFVKALDEGLMPDFGEKIKPWKLPFAPRRLKFLTDTNIIILILVFILSGMMIAVATKGYFPSYKDFLWTDDYLLVLVSLFIFGNLHLIFHEFAHLLCTYAIGGSGRIQFSRRFIYLVAETENYHMSIIPKAKRYIVYFAGMGSDFLFMSMCFWMMKTIDVFFPELIVFKMFLKANIVLLINGIIWQYNVFMETDMYNALSEYLCIENLRAVTTSYIDRKVRQVHALSGIVYRMLSRVMRLPKNVISHGETLYYSKKNSKQLAVYSFVLITGLVMAVIDIVFYQAPREFIIVWDTSKALLGSLRGMDFEVLIKSILILAIILYRYLVILFIEVQNRKKARQGQSQGAR